MENHSKNIFKSWKLWIGILIAILIIVVIIIFTLRNKLTPEETVSRFMYLIENKEYENAKKLSSKKLEYLDLLSNIKPSSLSFKFSEDKKNATAVVLEDKETAEMTNLYVELDNSILGWKIENYTINTDFIPQSVLQNRLENRESISESEFLLWALYDETDGEDISKYAEDNLTILTLFANFMKEQKYEKAFKLYKRMSIDVYNGIELSEQEIKDFEWNDYIISNNVELGGANVFIIKDNRNTINVMIGYDHIISHIYVDK